MRAHRLYCYCAVSALTFSTACFAQSSNPQGGAQSSENRLDEIVVTAQKRGQNLQSVPLAVTAVTSKQLDSAGIVSTEQLNVVAPGLNMRTVLGNFMPNIRGIGTSSFSVENPVALYIDDVYYADQRDGVRDLNDIDQVTILKGPQGTLFGRNATGGVIQITTKDPSHSFSVEAKTSIDNYATSRSSLYVTGGLGQDVAAGLSVSYAGQGRGWGHNLATGQETFKINHNISVRGKLLFEPSPDTKITLIADYLDKSDSMGLNWRPVPGTSSIFNPDVPGGSVYDNVGAVNNLNTFKSGGISAKIVKDFDFGQITSITSYRRNKYYNRWDTGGAPTRTIDLAVMGINETATQEFQISSSQNSDFIWTAGIFLFYHKTRQKPLELNLSGPASDPFDSIVSNTNAQERAYSAAPFVQVEYKILPRTRITLGGRWSYEKRDFSADGTTIMDGVEEPQNILVGDGVSKVTAKKPTWRIAIDHEFDRNILGYVSYNRGFKSGGFNIFAPTNPPYSPESLDAYEIGMKNELLDGRLRLNLAAFYYNYKNVQVVQFVNQEAFVVNGPKAELYGADIDLEAQLTRGLRLTGSAKLLHANFKNFPDAASSTPLPGGGAVLGNASATGHRLPLAQKFSGNIGLDYRVDMPTGQLNFNVTNAYNGNYFFEPDNRTKQKSYNILNLSAGWTEQDEKYSVSLWVRNVLNKHVISAAVTTFWEYQVNYGNPPRTFGITLSAKMN